MVEVLVMHYGIKVNVIEVIVKVVKRMVYYIIQNVNLVFIILVVVYVHQIV